MQRRFLEIDDALVLPSTVSNQLLEIIEGTIGCHAHHVVRSGHKRRVEHRHRGRCGCIGLALFLVHRGGERNLLDLDGHVLPVRDQVAHIKAREGLERSLVELFVEAIAEGPCYHVR